jgi:hypothetical protein
LAPTSTMWAAPVASKWVRRRGVIFLAMRGVMINTCALLPFALSPLWPWR